jgi:hypothetical protein
VRHESQVGLPTWPVSVFAIPEPRVELRVASGRAVLCGRAWAALKWVFLAVVIGCLSRAQKSWHAGVLVFENRPAA